MAVPTYEEFMLPILRLAADGAEHRFGSALERISEQLELTESDRSETLPSGQTRAYNRFCWAISYLQNARLLEKSGRGRFRISPRGREVLSSNLQRIDNQVLAQFPEFLEFKGRRKDASNLSSDPTTSSHAETPEERLEEAYQELRAALAEDILERVLKATPKFFEHLVIDLLVSMGYGGSRTDAAQVVGRAGDGGIDGTIKEDKLGLDVVYIQAKRWENTVGRKEIQSFVGSLDGERAAKGVFITTSTFSAEARDYVCKTSKKVVLIDGAELAQLMMDHGVGVTTVKEFSICRADSDYFEEAE